MSCPSKEVASQISTSMEVKHYKTKTTEKALKTPKKTNIDAGLSPSPDKVEK